MTIISLLVFFIKNIIDPAIIALGVGVVAFVILIKIFSRKRVWIFSIVSGVVVFVALCLISIPETGKTFGPASGPSISLKNIVQFFIGSLKMERVSNIARDPNDIPLSIQRVAPDKVKIDLEVKEVIGEMTDGTVFNYWTFDGTVPGPFLRVREGDTVELTLRNHQSSIHHHNIDLHAVTGPGGGAVLTNVAPGESKTMTFKALNAGLFVYHCAHTNPGTHMAHGMYGLILVEPKEGMAKVDKEFYVMQGEFYSIDELGSSGLQVFDPQKMIDGHPDYIVFNGKIDGVVGNMKAQTGDRVRIYVGNGGVNLVSSFHVIGEIFDRVYPEGAIGQRSAIFQNVQSTIVPAGGSAIVEFGLEVPGKYMLVDHALSRADRGAWGTIEVTGNSRPDIFNGTIETGGGH